MQLFLYITSSIAIAYLASIAVNKKTIPQFNLDPKKPFYASIWFFIASITPSVIGIWYLRHYIETKGVIINTPFSLFNFILEENIKAGLGFASLSLLLGIMVARFHASNQNAERIKMTLETTQYSNAFSHRKEFNETIKIAFPRPNERKEKQEINTNKLHSHLFSEAFNGSFRSNNIDSEFKELKVLDENLVYALKDCDISSHSYENNIYNSLSLIAQFISEKSRHIGADMFEFEYRKIPEVSERKLSRSFFVNGVKTNTIAFLGIIKEALEVRIEILEKSADFLPEIDSYYAKKITTYALYNKALKDVIDMTKRYIGNEFHEITKDKKSFLIDNKEPRPSDEELISHAIDSGIRTIFCQKQDDEMPLMKKLEKTRTEMQKETN